MELARSLDMEVVAEGVETEDQFQKLAALGCNYVQGFYFAKPAGAR
jgi:EAL domain-containing protein (putative c-di-GMP-specific phosphodiesterase class I)